MAERKIFNFTSETLPELTIKEEGYHPDKFGKTSNKFIWATCRFCGKPSRLRKGQFIKKGSACHKECRFKEQSISGSPFKDESVREKAKQTNLKKYGSEHANQNQEIARRISEGRKKAQSKITNTNLDKYGVENPFQSEEIKSKIRQTNLKKYGHEHAMQSDEIKEKTKQTNRDRHGVDNPMQVAKIHDQAVQTNIDRYGYPYPMQNPEVQVFAQEKFADTVKIDESGYYKLINVLRGDQFWKRMKQCDATLQELCDEFDVDYRSATSRLLFDEFRDKYYKHYAFPRQQQQKQVKELIESYGMKVIFNDRKTIAPLELDIFIPEKKFAIEFNGNYWHSEACLNSEDAKYKHITKTRKCQQNGIRLFHVFEHQWQTRQSQILNFIKSILGVNAVKIPARKCTVTNDECRQFFDDNHIQGYGARTIKFFNLVYDGQIVASMTASKHHRQNTDAGVIILNRLCFKDGFNLQGGSSKLFRRLVEWARAEGYNKILSWSDNCWTEGKVYEVLDFVMEQEYAPDYFYWDVKKHQVVSKQSQQKKKTGCPDGMTEREWCIERGLYRTWDCGKKKWVYRL